MPYPDDSPYHPAEDPAVRAKLERWQDLKLGLMMHFGLYSQWGIVESWTLCSEDEEWCARRKGRFERYEQYKEDYRALKRTFDPRRLDPKRWARAAAEAGMKYVLFTAKHHDGFCLFDTKQTDFKVTAKACPFHDHAHADITRAVLDAFRAEGLWTGVYFSKPDWSCEDYWWPYFATPDRHVNYDPARYPERWARFAEFTFRQIEELMTGYGPLDILWLDGAWVRPIANMPPEIESWARKKDFDQDIDLPRIAAMARRHQPGLLVVDRWVPGEHENYLTVEGRVPEAAIPHPWETCLPMAEGWSYQPRDRHKSEGELVRALAEVAARGGNLVLNVGPTPEGEWTAEVYDRLAGLRAFMAVNGEAIYGTRPAPPFAEGRFRFLGRKDGTRFALLLADDGDERPPERIRVRGLAPPPGAEVSLLGHPGEVAWTLREEGLEVEVPPSFRNAPPCRHAWALKIASSPRDGAQNERREARSTPGDHRGSKT